MMPLTDVVVHFTSKDIGVEEAQHSVENRTRIRVISMSKSSIMALLSGTTACCPLYEEHARETLAICILASMAEEARMEVLYESCCGLDIHKSSIACISFLSKSASPRGIFAASVVQHGIYLIWRSGSGRTIDFLLSERRDVAAAKRFFSKEMNKHGTPQVITLDAYAASHRAITELQSAGTLARRVEIRSSKYLNNVVEQDHRRLKQRVRAMPSRALRHSSSLPASCWVMFAIPYAPGAGPISPMVVPWLVDCSGRRSTPKLSFGAAHRP
ncbi:MAG: integrase core domain protein [Edaphobacter sp.]|nr:integrase core domain protein [Edaphobacter sp.]